MHIIANIIISTYFSIYSTPFLSSLSIYPGEPRTFSVSVTPLRNLPLDLYVLSDLSGSMGENLRALKQIGGNIGVYGHA